MTATAAVILMLNGVQLFLPAPALMLGGKAWAPLRPVAQRLGFSIDLLSGNRVFADRAGKHIPVTDQKRLHGTTYVPVRFFEKLGAAVTFDAAAHLVSLAAVFPESSPPAKAPAAIKSGPLLSFIISDPAPWANREVVLPGEFLGWRASPLWPALRFGPPVSRSDWVFRADGGAIYCTGQVPAKPLQDVGLRLQITATVRLAKKGWPYLDVASCSRAEAKESLCCYVTTDRTTYTAGQTPRAHLLVRNDGATPLSFTFPTPQLYDFVLRDAEGKIVWRWSHDRVFAQALSPHTFAPHEAMEFAEDIPLSAIDGITPGTYYVSAELVTVTQSFWEPIEVQPPQ
jgi:hypothetical protein